MEFSNGELTIIVSVAVFKDLRWSLLHLSESVVAVVLLMNLLMKLGSSCKSKKDSNGKFHILKESGCINLNLIFRVAF